MNRIILLISLTCTLTLMSQNANVKREGGKFFSDAFIHEACELYDWHTIENTLAQKMNTTPARCNDFFNFIFKSGIVSMQEYLDGVEKKKIDRTNALQYWLDKMPLFEKLFTEKYIPLTVRLNAGKQGENSVQTGGANCNNLDFSNATTGGWAAQWNNAANPPGSGVYGGLTVTGFNSSLMNRWGFVHELCTGGSDRNVPISTVPPGHNYALRLGNDSAYQILTNTGNQPVNLPYNHQIVSNTFMVTQQNKAVSYWYAVVLCQYNPNNHASNIQPYFKIRMYDGAGNEIMCAHYDVDALSAPSIGGFQTINTSIWDNNQMSAVPYDFFYKDWSQVMIPLNNFVGQNVTITFETSDCAGGGHPGYAYLAVDCAPMPNITITPFTCSGTSSTATLTAPSGAASYSWSGPGIVGSSANQAVTVNSAGSYTVTMTTLGNSGFNCSFSVDTTIGPPPPPITASFTAPSVCGGQPVQFTDQSNTNGATIASYHWNFGDGTTSSQQNPVHTYNPPWVSPLTVSYTITTTSGCIATNSSQVWILPSPTPVFTSNTVCVGSPTTFTNSTSGGSSYVWNFGDGGTSSVTNPTHTYPGASTYNATLTVTGANTCTSSISAPVVVTPQPTASFTANSACLGSPTNFNNTSAYGGSANFHWNFGDAGTSSDTSAIKNPTYTYPAAGVYTVSLSLTSGVGCAANTTATVSVKPLPSATVSSPAPFCPGSTVPSPTLASTPSSGVSYNWSNNNTQIGLGASGGGVPPPFVAGQNSSSGNMTGLITITPYLNGCAGPPATETIIIQPAPVIAQLPVELCPYDVCPTITISTMPSGVGVAVNWTNTTPGTYIGMTQNSGTNTVPGFTTINPGSNPLTNIISAYASMNGCTGPVGTFSITTNPFPHASFTHSPACEGNLTHFHDASSVNGGFIQQWYWDMDWNGTLDATGNAPDYSFPTPGTHTVHYTVESDKGCQDDTTISIWVNASPHVNIFGDVLSGCPVHTVNFIDSTTVAPPQHLVSYSWSFGNGTAWNSPGPISSSYVNQSHTANAMYTVSLTVTSDSGCVSTAVKPNYITVYPVPLAEFTWGPQDADVFDPQIQFYDQSIGASGPDAWNWNFGDTYVAVDSLNHSIIQSPKHTYSDQQEGTYTVTQIVHNGYGCVDSVKHEVTIKPNFAFYAPNAFTPNGNGLNDGFKGTGFGIDNSTYVMLIFDRWGNQVFESHDLEYAWDGKKHGEPVIQDTYVWKVEFRDMSGDEHHYKGVVNLIR